MGWAPPEADTQDAWAPPEATSWSPPEADKPHGRTETRLTVVHDYMPPVEGRDYPIAQPPAAAPDVAPVGRTRAFLQGAGVPTSLPELGEAAKFLLRSPVQDVKDIYSGLSEIPERLRNFKQSLSNSPAAQAYRDPLSPDAFRTYGTVSAALFPKLAEGLKTKPGVTEQLFSEAKPPEVAPELAQTQPDWGRYFELSKEHDALSKLLADENAYPLDSPERNAIYDRRSAINQEQTGLLQKPPAEVSPVAASDSPLIAQANEALAKVEPPPVITPAAPEPPPATPEVTAPEVAPKPKTFRGPADAFGSEVTPVSQYVIDNLGGVMSKSTAAKRGKFKANSELWEGAGGLEHPTHNKVYSPSGEMPDAAAQALYDAGLISDPYPDTMWNAIRGESKTARTLSREERYMGQQEAKAHAEWQDQLKAGAQDPGIALKGPDGEPALISRREDGNGVELSLLDKDGKPVNSLQHETLDDALKSAHEQGFLLADEAGNGKAIFDESASRAGDGNAGEAGQTPAPAQGAVGDASAQPPKLRPGEKQGDLLANQTEDLRLAGETGVDHGARQAAAEDAAKARAESDATDQTKLFDKAHDWTGATEPKPETLPIDQHAAQVKSKFKLGKGAKEGGFVNADVLGDVADFGKRVFEKGMDFAKWSAEMIRHLGDAVKEHLKTVWDSLTGKNLLPGRGESGAIGGIGIRKRTALDAATGERSAKLQRSFADAERAAKEIRKVAPSRKVQGGMSLFIEANGDKAKLASWEAAAKDPKFRDAAKAAQSLTPEQVAMAQKAKAAFGVLEQRGNQYDVLKSHKDNYVPHVWDVEKKFSGIGSSKLQDKFKFAKARTFENSFEGDQAGFKAKTLALGDLFPAYLHEMNKVIADRQFVQDVAHATASDGRPLVIPRGNAKTVDATEWAVMDPANPKRAKSVHDTEAAANAAVGPGQTVVERPSSSALVNPRGFAKAEDANGNPIEQGDYKALDQPALHDWRWVESDPNGNATVLKSDLAVHPDLAKRLNAMTGQSAIRQWYNEPSSGVSVIPKAIAKGLDTAQAVMKREMFSLLAPFHQVQEGTHAVGHTVNPFGGMEDMSKPTPEHIDAMKHGLMLQPDRASGQKYIEGVGGKGGFVAQAGRWLGEKADGKLVGKAGNVIASTVDGYQNYLFHQYIPALKFKTYQHIVERNMARYDGDIKAGKVSDADVKLLSAQQTNAAYGHLNYALLDRNPTMQHLLQLGLLAPDFLEARARFVGQAAKSLIGEKAGFEQFRAIAVLATTQAGIAYTVSKLSGGEWDPKHPFEVTIGNRRYTMRSIPEDFHRLFLQGWDSTREFVSARINPAFQKGIQLETGLNYRGEKTGALQTLGELFANYIPITARSIPGLRQLTETSRNSPVSPLEQLAGSIGVKVSRSSAITKAHQLANDWMDKQKIDHDVGTYPVSKFQPLRYALEDGDMARAGTEWKKLTAGDKDERKLAEGFKASVTHPFTGTKEHDADFADSLKGKDKLIYERALQVREGILDKFDALR